MRIVICDDERQYADFVEAAIEKWKASRKVTSIYVSKIQSSEDVCEGIGQSLPYDVAFLDIQFPGEMDGLKLAQMLKAQSEFMTLILMTNYQEYAIEGYRVSALRFLTKPLSESAIWECLDIAHHQWTLMNDRSLMIKTSQQVMRLPYRSIIYAESMAHYACLQHIPLLHKPFKRRGNTRESEALGRCAQAVQGVLSGRRLWSFLKLP